MIYRKVLEVAETGAIPIVLGGDHSITWPAATAIAEMRRPGSIGIVHFDAHADTASDDWGVLASHGTPMRRLIESGAVKGKNFVQVGLRGYWPPEETFEWMQEQGLRYHFMPRSRSAARRPSSRDAIDEALDGPDPIYLSLDIDVIDPGMAPGTGTPEPGGMLTREVLRASARSSVPWFTPAWTSWRSRRRTTTPRPRRWPRIAPHWKPSARWRSGATTATPSVGRADRHRRERTGRSAAWPGCYDLDLTDDPGDLDLYLALAERTGGPVLELACRQWPPGRATRGGR